MSEEMVEIPLERAQAFGELISAARAWRGSLIPSTSTGLWGPTKALVEAIAAFDRAPCDHPRSWRVFKVLHADAEEVCGYCGTTVVAGLRSDPGDSSSPPESSSPSP